MLIHVLSKRNLKFNSCSIGHIYREIFALEGPVEQCTSVSINLFTEFILAHLLQSSYHLQHLTKERRRRRRRRDGMKK